VANLFRNLHTKFRQNRPSFKGDITKTFWSFFRDTLYNPAVHVYWANVLYSHLMPPPDCSVYSTLCLKNEYYPVVAMETARVALDPYQAF